jgi:hypothetical protein
MGRNKYERDLIRFLQKYPNQWHTYNDDAKTIRAVATLHLLHGLKVNINTNQMYWTGKGYSEGMEGGAL